MNLKRSIGAASIGLTVAAVVASLSAGLVATAPAASAKSQDTAQPPGPAPTRLRFLARNRLIAALTRGTPLSDAALERTVAAITSIGFFIDRVRGSVAQEAAGLIAADLRHSGSDPLNPDYVVEAQRRGLDTAQFTSRPTGVVAGESRQAFDERRGVPGVAAEPPRVDDGHALGVELESIRVVPPLLLERRRQVQARLRFGLAFRRSFTAAGRAAPLLTHEHGSPGRRRRPLPRC